MKQEQPMFIEDHSHPLLDEAKRIFYEERYQSINHVLNRKEHGFSPCDYIPYIEELRASLEALISTESRQWIALGAYARRCDQLEKEGEKDASALLKWREIEPELQTSEHYYTIWSWGLEYGWQLALSRLQLTKQDPNFTVYQQWYASGYTQTWRDAGYYEDRVLANPFNDEQHWRNMVISKLSQYSA